jgi:hypothetical protein
MEKTKPESGLKDDYPVLVALATFVGYVITFAYETGVCHVYKVPLALISLNPSNVLATACVVSPILLCLFIVYKTISQKPVAFYFATGILFGALQSTVGVVPALLYYLVAGLAMLITWRLGKFLLSGPDQTTNSKKLEALAAFALAGAEVVAASYLVGVNRGPSLPSYVLRKDRADYLELVSL